MQSVRIIYLRPPQKPSKRLTRAERYWVSAARKYALVRESGVYS